jgi:hypothetical protein
MGANPLQGWALKIKTFLGPEMATRETHVHKIANTPVFLYITLGHNDFDGGKFIT